MPKRVIYFIYIVPLCKDLLSWNDFGWPSEHGAGPTVYGAVYTRQLSDHRQPNGLAVFSSLVPNSSQTICHRLCGSQVYVQRVAGCDICIPWAAGSPRRVHAHGRWRVLGLWRVLLLRRILQRNLFVAIRWENCKYWHRVLNDIVRRTWHVASYNGFCA